MSNTPSVAEIDAFLDSPANLIWVIASNRERYRLLVREVLAKWGTPPAGTVPLTDEQWQRIADLTGGRILTQAVKDEIERVIGIKGGHHGTK